MMHRNTKLKFLRVRAQIADISQRNYFAFEKLDVTSNIFLIIPVMS
jgi:hypothetical protein